jgi:hypothetical protein
MLGACCGVRAGRCGRDRTSATAPAVNVHLAASGRILAGVEVVDQAAVRGGTSCSRRRSVLDETVLRFAKPGSLVEMK